MKKSDTMRIRIGALLLSSFLMSEGVAGEVVVVVSAKSPVTSLTKAQVSNIFLGKTNRFPNGSMAVPYDQTEESVKRGEFYSEFLDRTPSQIKSHWAKIIFTGRGQPPKALHGDSAVKNQVAANPAAIGYIDEALVDETLRIVTRR